MVDERPRPQYGEYATPQEQAEIVARSMPPVSPLLTPGDQPAAVQPVVPPASVAPSTSAGVSREPSTGRPPRPWDRILSVALLAYGLITAIAGLVQYADLASLIQEVYDAQGIGTFTFNATVATVSVAIRVMLFAVWAVTALLTVRVLRTGRLAFYIPIVGGFVAGITTFVLLAVLLVSDPGFLAYVQGMQS